MKKTSHKAARADGILSAEELEKAIAEYKAKYGAQNAEAEKTDAEETTEVAAKPEAAAEKPAPVKAEPKVELEVEDADDPEAEPLTVEEQVEEIKDEHKDEDNPDMQKLFDIIDSLLAEREFKGGKAESADSEEEEQEVAKPKKGEPELEEIVADGEDDEEIDLEAEEQTDADEEEDVDPDELDIPEQEDEDDDIIPNQEAEDCGDENCDENDDPIPDYKPSDLKPGEVLNADSVDKIVRARIDVGMMGKALNMDGLERMNLMKARKAVIKAVRPGMRLDGKSAAFINAAYAMACEEIRTRKRKDTKYQKRQMFNGTKRPMAHADSSDKARDRMIKKQMSRSK